MTLLPAASCQAIRTCVLWNPSVLAAANCQVKLLWHVLIFKSSSKLSSYSYLWVVKSFCSSSSKLSSQALWLVLIFNSSSKLPSCVVTCDSSVVARFPLPLLLLFLLAALPRLAHDVWLALHAAASHVRAHAGAARHPGHRVLLLQLTVLRAINQCTPSQNTVVRVQLQCSEAGVLDEPYSAKPSQRSSHKGPPGYMDGRGSSLCRLAGLYGYSAERD